MKEAAILRQIADYLSAQRIFFFRLNTGSLFGGSERRWAFRAHSLGAGAADILALPAGLPPLWIEVKNQRGRQSQAQKEFERTVREQGHKYVVARSIDDLPITVG